jgi:hypothetical protein
MLPRHAGDPAGTSLSLKPEIARLSLQHSLCLNGEGAVSFVVNGRGFGNDL